MLSKAIYRLSSFAKPLSSYNPQVEEVLIVDRDNNRIGSATRQMMRQQKLIHRSTYIFILNPENKLFVQKRTVTKDIFPGFYDVAPGGVVLANELSDYESASRELEEEMGIKTDSLEFCFNHFYPGGPVWCAVFLARWDKPIVLQPEEVQWVELMAVQEVFERSRSEDFCPDSVEILRILCDQGKIVVS